MYDKKDDMELTSDMSREEIDLALKKFREMVKEMKETGQQPVLDDGIDIVDVEIEEEPLEEIESIEDIDDIETGYEPVSDESFDEVEDSYDEVEELDETGLEPVVEEKQEIVKTKKKGNKKTKRLFRILIILVIMLVISFIVLFGLKKINRKIGKLTVTFDSDGGSDIYKEKVYYAEKIKEPIEPTKIGYEFVGWYLDGEKYDFNTPIKKNIKLVAHWKSYSTKPLSGIRLDQDSATIQINTSITLVAYLEPSTADKTTITWSSSDPSVATVDSDGNVKGLKEGTSTITAETKEGGFKATCNITVAKKIINVTGIRFDKTTYTLSQGKTLDLKPIITPSNANNKGIIWSSSDFGIASVMDGKVTAYREGTVTISATTKDGNYTAKIILDVIDIPLVGLNIVGKQSVAKGATIQLEADYSPVNTTHKQVRWQSENPNILEVNDKGVVTGKNIGKANVILMSENGGLVTKKEIEVTDNNSVYNITLDKKELALYLGESSNLVATVYPKTALDKKVIWSSSNESIVKVVNGKISAVGEGTAIIKAVTNDGGYKSVCSVTVKKKEPVYTVSIQKGTQNTFVVQKDGEKIVDYVAVLYNNIPLKEGNNISSDDIDETIKTVKVKLSDDTLVNANVTYN